jgi:RNA polymerase sigma factor (sigma-70 family)
VTRELERTYRSSGPRLLGWIRSKIGSAEEAEDILHEVFASALASFSLTEPIENLVAWLFRAARNRVVDWYRRRGRRALPLDSELIEELLASEAPADEAEQAELEAELEAGIDELPEAQRQVIIEQAIEGRTFREIAERTGIPIGTLLARKHAAIRSLRRRLEDFR